MLWLASQISVSQKGTFWTAISARDQRWSGLGVQISLAAASFASLCGEITTCISVAAPQLYMRMWGLKDCSISTYPLRFQLACAPLIVSMSVSAMAFPQLAFSSGTCLNSARALCRHTGNSCLTMYKFVGRPFLPV